MKHKSLLIKNYLRLSLLFVTLSLSLQLFSSVSNTKSVTLAPEEIVKATWGEDDRIVVVYKDGDLLSIHSESNDCNIVVNIQDSYGRTIIQKEIPSTDTSLVIIPIDNLPDGSYTLQLSTSSGNYLSGNFNKDMDRY